MTALCTASPYPELVIGNGEISEDVKTVKRLCDSDKWIKDQLNPNFFRLY